jgi:type VI protein secretion system component Hcp
MASSILLQLKGLTGGSDVKDHTGWIELKSYDCSFANSTNLHKKDSAGTGTVTINDIACVKDVDKVSADLQLRACNGAPFDHGIIHVLRTAAGEDPSVFLVIKVKPCVIANYAGGSYDQSSEATDRFALHFAEIGVKYLQEDGSDTSFGWNLQKNEKVASPDTSE